MIDARTGKEKKRKEKKRKEKKRKEKKRKRSMNNNQPDIWGWNKISIWINCVHDYGINQNLISPIDGKRRIFEVK